MTPEHYFRVNKDDDLNHLIGQQLDQFQVVERIGSGGMATVFKAYQPSLDRHVAIKVLPTRHAQNPVFFKRFVQEARSIARLAHPHIVHIYNFGEQDIIKYIVMEYVDGGTLKERVKQPLPVQQAVDFVLQAAKGLDCAHSNGIIHRDVKPANMLLRNNGHLLLSDFGLAKILEQTTDITRTGVRLGTPHYMSPEQGTGQTVDARTDIYSLGIVLFHCLTGEPPFQGDNALSITVKHVHDPLPVDTLIDDYNVPDPIIQALRKMTAKQPNERHQSTGELIDDLSAALADAYPTPRRGGTGEARKSPPPLRQIYNLTPQGNIICFRCGDANASERFYCVTCGEDLTNKRAHVDRYFAPNGHPIIAGLLLQTGPMAGRTFRFHQCATTIGRGAGNDFVITGRSVSRHHALLDFIDGYWYLEDQQSGNGTQVNGQRVYSRVLLKHGDIVQFGDERAIFTMITDERAKSGNIFPQSH